MRDGWPRPGWRSGFTYRRFAGGLEPQITVAAGETFRLLLPRRLARQGALIPYEEIAGNPALVERWTGAPLG